MQDKYRMPCGCAFDRDSDRLVIDDENLPECQLTWDLFATGKTKGVFQLETNLGQHWTKTLKPENFQHLSALVAILRPACLKAIMDNKKSMTFNYCERKNRLQEVVPVHPIVDKILEKTYGILCYQEQVLAIVQQTAGFSLSESDFVRKSISKKQADEVARRCPACLDPL